MPSGLIADPATLSPRAREWAQTPGATPPVVNVFHPGYWGGWSFELASASPPTATANATLRFGAGGWQEARGATTGGGWWVENVLAELDAPGEWFYDGARLYYGFNRTEPPPPPPPAPAPFVASRLANVLTLTGSPRHPVADVTLDGLTFAHTAATTMRPFTVASGGDWSTYRGGAVLAEGTARLAVARCTFLAPGGNGLVLSRWHVDAAVTDSEFVWTGESGLVLLGAPAAGVDASTDAEFPVGTRVVGNLFHECVPGRAGRGI